MEVLRTENLSKYFGGVSAVKDVSFSVRMGEKLALIGPNGAGKTTLLNLINGQLKPTEGKIYCFGQDITRLPVHGRAHIGQARSFQIVSLFYNLTVITNALLAVQGTKPSRYQLFRPITSYDDTITTARELLEEMNLWDKRDELVQNLAYGEQRRLEITLSIASEPRLLLLDEPSCGLTPSEGIDMINLIRELRKNITIIMVAHDMDLVFGLAERIIVLNYGEIVADGTPAEIQANEMVRKIYLGIEEGTSDAGAR